MQLSAELFSQIVKDLVSDNGGAVVRQQRREPRVGVRARAHILPILASATLLPVRVRDLSAGGMGLLVPRELAAGQLFLLLLPKAGIHPPLRLACTVAHCHTLAEDLFAVGARFASREEIACLGPGVSGRAREWHTKLANAARASKPAPVAAAPAPAPAPAVVK